MLTYTPVSVIQSSWQHVRIYRRKHGNVCHPSRYEDEWRYFIVNIPYDSLSKKILIRNELFSFISIQQFEQIEEKISLVKYWSIWPWNMNKFVVWHLFSFDEDMLNEYLCQQSTYLVYFMFNEHNNNKYHKVNSISLL
jgi:hypothetical protein